MPEEVKGEIEHIGRVSTPYVIRAVNCHEELVEALGGSPCPRPLNGHPDDFTVNQCVGASECGCLSETVRRALKEAISKLPGRSAYDRGCSSA